MKPFESQNEIAGSYLKELQAALRDGVPQVRDEVLNDIADTLRGLDADETRARIRELGAPSTIAADAMAETPSLEAPGPSRAYPIIMSIALIAGWYLVPVLGWVAGLIMIGASQHWSSRVRRNGILASVAVIVVSTIGIFAFRGTEAWVVGVIIFAVLPLLGNIFVADYLRRRWAVPSQR
ncbi:HAAS signaling domain-containing protein [Pseudoclavibacter sp. VKM Ac-2867]|uniref:HAAS signaling domain-containing protein n=1 Tax=Pseudoclavibacter sp. VKM Ac-2867 TaxID=2783829 RepID=UPI001889FF8E|nr:hypothetical protein [Pseudoclavibacter sp. VKM Ac-2867]MBF4457863.1 hypothetical protein [Pseudoclavibacter sp. VKM Ac-2867]